MVFLAYIHILLELTHVARSSHIAHILPTNIPNRYFIRSISTYDIYMHKISLKPSRIKPVRIKKALRNQQD